MSALQTMTTNIMRGAVAAAPVPEGYTARMALDDQTRRDAYAIRHASYLAGGYIDPQPEGLFSDADDLRPNQQCVVVYKDGTPAASMRLSTLDYTPGLEGFDEIPATRIFPEEMKQVAARVTHGRPPKIAEINRLVRHPDYRDSYEMVFILYRFVSFFVIGQGTDMMVNCVRRNHTPFYRRMHFGYVAGPRRYAGVKFATNLMACPREKYFRSCEEIPFVAMNDASWEAYAGLFRGETVNVFVEG